MPDNVSFVTCSNCDEQKLFVDGTVAFFCDSCRADGWEFGENPYSMDIDDPECGRTFRTLEGNERTIWECVDAVAKVTSGSQRCPASPGASDNAWKQRIHGTRLSVAYVQRPSRPVRGSQWPDAPMYEAPAPAPLANPTSVNAESYVANIAQRETVSVRAWRAAFDTAYAEFESRGSDRSVVLAHEVANKAATLALESCPPVVVRPTLSASTPTVLNRDEAKVAAMKAQREQDEAIEALVQEQAAARRQREAHAAARAKRAKASRTATKRSGVKWY